MCYNCNEDCDYTHYCEQCDEEYCTFCWDHHKCHCDFDKWRDDAKDDTLKELSIAALKLKKEKVELTEQVEDLQIKNELLKKELETYKNTAWVKYSDMEKYHKESERWRLAFEYEVNKNKELKKELERI